MLKHFILLYIIFVDLILNPTFESKSKEPFLAMSRSSKADKHLQIQTEESHVYFPTLILNLSNFKVFMRIISTSQMHYQQKLLIIHFVIVYVWKLGVWCFKAGRK